jgi:putative ABC transport system permease protein
VTPLNRKLLRDLYRARAQSVAIGLVIAVGVLLLVMMSGLVSSLERTKQTYYAHYHLADVFAPVTRSPDRMLQVLQDIPGVTAVQGRVTGPALIDVSGEAAPLRAEVVSLPDDGQATLNAIRLVRGRSTDPLHPDDIVLLNSFAVARGLEPGDRLEVTLNGIRRSLRIVGLAESPEFLYTTPPGEMAPDPARYAVIWMGQSAAAAAFDLKDSFSEALLALSPDARLPTVLAAVNRQLAPYGGTGAYGLEDLLSNRFVSDEIGGLRAVSSGVPPIFLGVAAFLLYIVVSRMVQAEREQIGLLKAFGYTQVEVGAHYFKFVLVIAVAGALAGSVLGIWAGNAMAGFYLNFFRFPSLVFRPEPFAFVTGFLSSVLTAAAGGLLAMQRVFILQPAEAMRPPVPQDYSGGRVVRGLAGLGRRVDPISRMVLRRLIRHPGRTGGSVIGIVAGMALTVAMLTIMSSYDCMLTQSFDVIDRSDLAVSFNQPRAKAAVFELTQLPGVISVEPVRSVSVVFKHDRHHYRGAITGLPADARLYRAIDKDRNQVFLPERGIILSTTLAGILGVHPGDRLSIEVQEGRRPVLSLPVVGLADALLGAPAFMDMQALDRALKEPGQLSGAYLLVDRQKEDGVFQSLKEMPSVAGVSIKREARTSLAKTLNTGAGVMRFIFAGMAAVIAFGIVFNTARIAFAERLRELATLRVIGFTRAEVASVLLGELGAIILLALPLGALLGYYLSFLVAAGFSTDQYQIPVAFSPPVFGEAALAVLAAAILSGTLVWRDVERIDLVGAIRSL